VVQPSPKFVGQVHDARSRLTTQAQRRPRRRGWSARCAHELPRRSNGRRRGRSLSRR
jgi:hypothetical protein